jgi:hypothetical protein
MIETFLSVQDTIFIFCFLGIFIKLFQLYKEGKLNGRKK